MAAQLNGVLQLICESKMRLIRSHECLTAAHEDADRFRPCNQLSHGMREGVRPANARHLHFASTLNHNNNTSITNYYQC